MKIKRRAEKMLAEIEQAIVKFEKLHDAVAQIEDCEYKAEFMRGYAHHHLGLLDSRSHAQEIIAELEKP